VTAADVVSSTTVTSVWLALGGDQPSRFGRARAFYRDGNNWQAVSLNDEKGVWYDHRDHVGGGILSLVQHVRKCNRADAARWVADLIGATLDDRPMTRADRREYARRRAQAEREAIALLRWKEGHRAALRAAYHRLWKLHHACTHYIIANGLDTAMGDAAANVVEVTEGMIERLREQIDLFDGAAYADLLVIFRGKQRVAA